MHKIIDQPTKAPPGADGLEAVALRAAAWAGEPFLHQDEDPAVALASGTALRIPSSLSENLITSIAAALQAPSLEKPPICAS